jgi:hypothetical protein
MKPSIVLSFTLCAMFAADFAQTLLYYFYFADRWYWKSFLASASIEMGFLTLFSEHDISVLAVALVATILLLADSLAATAFVSLSVASFIVHYLIETLVNESFRDVARILFVPTVWMSQSMRIPVGSISSINSVPVLALFALFGIQAVLKTFCK